MDLTYLPAVVLVEILSYLSLGDLFNASLVCRKLHNLFRDPVLWRRLTLEIHLLTKRHGELVSDISFSKHPSYILSGMKSILFFFKTSMYGLKYVV